MTTQGPQGLSQLDEALYRLGNSSSAKLDNVRPDDVTVYDRKRGCDGTFQRIRHFTHYRGPAEETASRQLCMEATREFPMARGLVQLLLEALRVCDQEWLATIEGTDNEDVEADYDNDRCGCRSCKRPSNTPRLRRLARR
jgi:hypothetical protein